MFSLLRRVCLLLAVMALVAAGTLAARRNALDVKCSGTVGTNTSLPGTSSISAPGNGIFGAKRT